MRTTFCFLMCLLLGKSASTDGFERDCTPENMDHLRCSLYKLTNQGCTPTSLQERFPALYNPTDRFPGTPNDFKSKIDYDYVYKNVTYASVNLTFTPMRNVGIFYVKGFELLRLRSDTATQDCFIFDLSNATWTGSVEEYQNIFWYRMSPLKPESWYNLKLYALPKPNLPEFDEYLELNVAAPASVSTASAQSWQTTISYQKHERTQQIEVSFYPPPERFNFEMFIIWLWNTEDKQPLQMNYINQTSFTFTDVAPGNYTIRVQPFDQYYDTMDPSRCLCVKDSRCERCVTTETDVFNMRYIPTTTTSTTTITPSTTTSTPTTMIVPHISTPDSTSDLGVKVGLAVVGGVMGVALAAVLLYCYCYRCKNIQGQYCTDDKGGQDNEACDKSSYVLTLDGLGTEKVINNSNVKNMIQLGKRLKLFLLFEDDHEYHRMVVNNFASYLQQHCHCDVMCAEWQLDTAWVHEDLNCADYIVVVNSEKAYNSYMKEFSYHKNNRDSPSLRFRCSNSINSIRNKFRHEERYDNIVMVYFEYTQDQYLIPDICPGYKYKLMKNFTEFLLHIHKLHRTDDLSRYDLPLDGNHQLKPIGQRLISSINLALRHEKERVLRPLDFLRSNSTMSDGQLDSGLPEDIGSPGATPSFEKTEQQFRSDMEKKLLELLDRTSQDAVTISPSGDQQSQIEALKSSPVYLKPLKIGQYSMDPNSCTPSPPTAADSVISEFDFFPPDDISNFDAISKSQSEQMKCIVDRYQAYNKGRNSENKGEVPASCMEGKGERQSGGYNKEADLDLLKMHSSNLVFGDEEGESISLGGQSV